MERISLIEGKVPVIFVAPHISDSNTDVIASSAAKAINGFAVINNGWIRADKHDYDQEHADLNNLEHCQMDVVKDEFLDPIIRFWARSEKKYPNVFFFNIHGFANNSLVHSLTNMIIGWGNGNPTRHTCDEWMKDKLIYHAEEFGWDVCESKKRYAAWKTTNLTQLFRGLHYEPGTHAMQLEICHAQRDTKFKAEMTGELLAQFISEIICYSHWEPPHGFYTKIIS